MRADATSGPSSGPSIFALPGRLGDVEALPRAEWPSARRFREYYAPPCGSRVDAAAGIPVVLLGAAAEMPASSRWTDEAFAARDSPYAVTLDNVELAKTETRAAGEAKSVPLAAFVRHYRDGAAASESDGGGGGGESGGGGGGGRGGRRGGGGEGGLSLYCVSSLPRPLRHDVWLPPPLACGSGTQRLAEAILWFSSGGAQPAAHADGDS